MKLDGKLALVTGAGSGIGRATAHALAKAGARLVVCDVDPARTADVAAELGDACLLARPVDVGDRAAMAAFADEVHQLAPALDVLVNNAGVGLAGGILDTPLDSWDWLLRVNLMGVIHGCHFFAPAMAARRSGHIVNVSSIFGYFASPSVVAYVASKFAVLGMSMSMRGELAHHNVGVTAICPGLIATNIINGSRMSETIGGMRDRVADTFAKRGASPSKVADAIVRAVRRDRVVVPVALEAWLAWGFTRAMPGMSSRFASRFEGVLGLKHG